LSAFGADRTSIRRLAAFLILRECWRDMAILDLQYTTSVAWLAIFFHSSFDLSSFFLNVLLSRQCDSNCESSGSNPARKQNACTKELRASGKISDSDKWKIIQFRPYRAAFTSSELDPQPEIHCYNIYHSGSPRQDDFCGRHDCLYR
jgi:hypothetical protein